MFNHWEKKTNCDSKTTIADHRGNIFGTEQTTDVVVSRSLSDSKHYSRP